MEKLLNELKEKGHTVYSISRLNTFLNCEYEYYKSYIKKEKGIDNVYTILGSFIHDNIQQIHEGKKTLEQFRIDYENKLIELDMLGINFPNSNIEENWKKDIGHFVNTFDKIDKKMLMEKLIVFEITDGIFIQGYIDVIMPSERGKPYVNVYDWKTSSKFTGKKLDEAGRQLIMYKIGLEKISDYKVDKVMWYMLKYVDVCWKLKNGKVKRKMCNRGKWVKEMRNQFEKELYQLGKDTFEVELLLDQAVQDNKIDCLPDKIKEKYWLEDSVVVYEYDDKKVEEFKRFVTQTVNEIESKDMDNEDEWKPIKINKSNSFYCSVLCSQRKTCKYYKEYLEENIGNFDKKDTNDPLDLKNLFG